tara:strand:+ start:3488 stop:4237 length:750 start_codon:yes stop_codon:yes gene_type:complete
LKPRKVRGIVPYTLLETYHLLEEFYGEVEHRPKLPPADELIWTILSQHTSDLNAGRAFDDLKDHFPNWESVLEAPVTLLSSVIRSGGLANQKAPRIQEVLKIIKERVHSFDLFFLAEMELAEAKEWLTSLPGVGPKTAAVVLSFALGMPAFAVDTHIHRVAKRLALIGPKVSADEAHDVLENSIEPDKVFPAHVYLITHGRQICKSLRPLCNHCVLKSHCPSYSVMKEQKKISLEQYLPTKPTLIPKPL